MNENQINLTYAINRSTGESIRKNLTIVLSSIGLSDCQITDLKLIIDEIVNNAVEHGGDELIEIFIKINPATVYVSFQCNSHSVFKGNIEKRLHAIFSGESAPFRHNFRGKGLRILSSFASRITIKDGVLSALLDKQRLGSEIVMINYFDLSLAA